MLKNLFFRSLGIITFLWLVSSCTPLMHQPLHKTDARLGPETPMKEELKQLPLPKEKIVAAVYKFRDQTGQYKASNSGASWSTAVTQGATTILIRALEESGWFVPIERENISNLLNERKIIRSSREQYEGNNGNILLPPLLFAGVILEGGIISYETNVLTGGAGLRYFGTGGNTQYREDRVSIYLRAVSTSNGKVLKTVYTTKSILSQEVDFGVFRYVKFKRLLEAETGYTYNEPTEMAVTEAIEKAVYSLIVEGITENLWLMENANDTIHPAIVNYQTEKEENLVTDYLGKRTDFPGRPNTSFGVNGGIQFYNGDYSRGNPRPSYGISFQKGLNRYFSIELSAGGSGLHSKNKFDSFDLYADMGINYMFLPYENISPFVSAKGGLLFDTKNNRNVGISDDSTMPYIGAESGIEYLIGTNFTLKGSVYLNYLLSDLYDNAEYGEYNDSFWGFCFGIKYYFGKY